MRLLIPLLTVLGIVSCTNSHKIQEVEIPLESITRTPGIVLLLPDSLEYYRDSIFIQTSQGNIVNVLYWDEGERSVRMQHEQQIKNYYPDYYIIQFEGYPMVKEGYPVLINDTLPLVSHKK